MKRVRDLFHKARAHCPSIIFFDEIDGLFLSREGELFEETRKIIGTILEELDGLEERHGIMVLGATNRLNDIDPALIRPGRFDRLIEIPLPDTHGRLEIFKVHTHKLHLADDVNLIELAELSATMSGAEIGVVCQKAAYSALKKHMKTKNIDIEAIEDARGIVIGSQDLIDAVNEVK